MHLQRHSLPGYTYRPVSRVSPATSLQQSPLKDVYKSLLVHLAFRLPIAPSQYNHSPHARTDREKYAKKMPRTQKTDKFNAMRADALRRLNERLRRQNEM